MSTRSSRRRPLTIAKKRQFENDTDSTSSLTDDIESSFSSSPIGSRKTELRGDHRDGPHQCRCENKVTSTPGDSANGDKQRRRSPYFLRVLNSNQFPRYLVLLVYTGSLLCSVRLMLFYFKLTKLHTTSRPTPIRRPSLDTSRMYSEQKSFQSAVKISPNVPVVTSLLDSPRSLNKYTVILRPKTYDRLDLIQLSIDHFSKCTNVHQIQLDWRGGSVPSSFQYHSTIGSLHIIDKDSSATFTATTEAALLIEEDLLFSCQDLQKAYRLWKQYPDRMVGFFAFHYSLQKQPENQHSLEKVSNYGNSYSMISDRAAFVNQSYLNLLHQTTKERAPCQNIELSIQISSLTGKPPLRVIGTFPETRSSEPYLRHQQALEEERMTKSSTCLSSLFEKNNLKVLPLEELTYLSK